MKKEHISAKGFMIQIYTEDFENDFVCLTDIARYKNNDDPRFVIQNWMRNRNTLEFIGLWEILNNTNFNRVQFDTFRNEAGLNRFIMTPQKWIDSTNAIRINQKAWENPKLFGYTLTDYRNALHCSPFSHYVTAPPTYAGGASL